MKVWNKYVVQIQVTDGYTSFDHLIQPVLWINRVWTKYSVPKQVKAKYILKTAVN